MSMSIQRITVFLLVMGIAFTTMAVVTFAGEPPAYRVDSADGDGLAVSQADLNLPACGTYDEMRLLEPPAQATAAPTNTPDPTAPTPAPTNTPRPAPSEDRVGFPENYETDFKLLFLFDRPDRKLVRAICGNDIAAQTEDGEPFAYGSVLLMISWSAKLDASGQPVLDDNGHFIRERLVALHVMRKEEGFGEAYGEDRNGEWEYIAFNGDGSYQNTAETTNFCAVCHKNEGGEAVDYVFRMNLFHEGEEALLAPVAGENEVSIYLYGFHEPVLEIKAGTTVTWVNNDQAAHNVMSAITDDAGKVIRSEEPLFSSDLLPSVTIQPGASFSYTFDEPGEFLYLCTVHANMSGKIVVTD